MCTFMLRMTHFSNSPKKKSVSIELETFHFLDNDHSNIVAYMQESFIIELGFANRVYMSIAGLQDVL